jgi:hypothetical protein
MAISVPIKGMKIVAMAIRLWAARIESSSIVIEGFLRGSLAVINCFVLSKGTDISLSSMAVICLFSMQQVMFYFTLV